MGASNVFTLGTIVTSAGQINQIENLSVSPGVQTILYSGSGQVERRYAAAMYKSPLLSFTTSAIVRALTAAGINGLALAGSATDAYFQKHAIGSTRTNTACTKFSFSYGLLCPRILSAQDGQHATLGYELAARSNDGTTDPMAIAIAQTMPAVTAEDQLFTVGPANINGTAIADVQSISVDFGLSLQVLGGGGEAFPTFININRRAPSITIRSLDLSLLDTFGTHVAQGATDSLFYLRKIAQGGTRVANATTEHVRFSVDDGIITAREIGASDGAEPTPAMAELLIEPTWDGTADTIALSLGSAIA